MTIKIWIHGLIGAFIGGFATAITVMIIDPVQFNLTTQLSHVLEAALTSGIINAAFYLKKSPLPDDNLPPEK